MTIASLTASLESSLAIASFVHPASLASFVRLANPCMATESLPAELDRYYAVPVSLWWQIVCLSKDLSREINPGVTPPPPPLWVAWRGMEGTKGVALLFAGADERHFLVLPNGTEPEGLFIHPIAEGLRLSLLPNDETSRRHRLSYFPCSRILIPERLTRGLRNDWVHRWAIGERPEIFEGDTTGAWVLADDPSAQRALWVLGRGANFLLGRERPSAAPEENLLPLEGVLRAFSTFVPIGTRVSIPTERFVAGIDPLSTPITVSVSEGLEIVGPHGTPIGRASIAAGGAEEAILFPETHLYAATEKGGRDSQEDGVYLAHFEVDGTVVRVIAGADGLGGAEQGELASSAFLQGVHAAVARAAAQGRIPLAGELFDAGAEALGRQIHFLIDQMLQEAQQNRLAPEVIQKFLEGIPDTVGSVVVAAGDQATIATAGDFLGTYHSPRSNGTLEVQGHTPLDTFDDTVVMRTVGMRGKRLFSAKLTPGSYLVFGSDGAFDCLLGLFKRRTSPWFRRTLGEFRPDDYFFRPIETMMNGTPQEYIAEEIVAWAMQGGRETDNASAVVLYQPRQFDHTVPLVVPAEYRPLETVNRFRGARIERGLTPHPFSLNLHHLSEQLHPGTEFAIAEREGHPILMRITEIKELSAGDDFFPAGTRLVEAVLAEEGTRGQAVFGLEPQALTLKTINTETMPRGAGGVFLNWLATQAAMAEIGFNIVYMTNERLRRILIRDRLVDPDTATMEICFWRGVAYEARAQVPLGSEETLAAHRMRDFLNVRGRPNPALLIDSRPKGQGGIWP